ncbi:MAG: PilZ domain-containing protein [Planctomycetota bacterium]
MPFPRQPTPNTPPITDAEINAILGELDRIPTPPEVIAQREHARIPYREPVAVVCEVGDWPGDVVRFTAVCHDLSDGGLGILSPVPLKPGTLAVFTLVTATGEQLPLSATLAYCEEIRDEVYKCGAKFDVPIDCSAFCTVRRAG